MGFFVTTLIFIMVGIIASLMVRICCNRGPSANLYGSFHSPISSRYLLIQCSFSMNLKLFALFSFIPFGDFIY